MPKPNNPYAHSTHATKDSAMTVGEYYGTRVTDKVLSNVAGKHDASPASRYQAVGNAYVAPSKPAPKPKPKAKPIRPSNRTVVTAEDLFE